jgi:hypothetical protein
MTCGRGQASPDRLTQLRLFATSAGYCQNPGCQRDLFLDTGSKRIHIAEMAHVFAATDDGPRANTRLSEKERGAFDNLILLCPSCHTLIDKAEVDFPPHLLAAWKRDSKAQLAKIFGARPLATRDEVLGAIRPLLRENKAIFDEYNPNREYKDDPESEMARLWQGNMRSRIIPNSRRILAILDANSSHMTESEETTLELFRQHVHETEARHLTDIVEGFQRRFPLEMLHMMQPP